MLNRRGFLKNLLGAGAVLASAPALAAMKEIGHATPESGGKGLGERGDDIYALLSKYSLGCSCLVKVTDRDVVVQPDDAIDITIYCLGYSGAYFQEARDALDVKLAFFVGSSAERDAILANFPVGSIYAINGEFYIDWELGSIGVLDPEYHVVEPLVSEWFNEKLLPDSLDSDGHPLPLEWRV